MSTPFVSGSHTDTANAERLATLHGDRLRYVPKWGTWLVWQENVWRRDDRGVLVAELAKDIGRDLLLEAAASSDERLGKWGIASLSANRIRAAIELGRGIPGIVIDHEALDRDPWLLGVQNGVIDLRNGTFRPADPKDLMTMQAAVEWDADANAPRWRQALEEWFPDPDVRAYVQRVAGAALVGEQRDHVFIILFGFGANGKGTFIRALVLVLGDYAVTPHLSLLVHTKHGEHDTIKASLFRSRLAVASETEKRVKLAEASVKNLTGRDRITCRRLYENPWSFDPSHSLWLQTNYLPEIAGRDHGIWRRIRVIPWIAKFERANSSDLDTALAAEGPGILRWLVEGCLAWQKIGLAEPEAVIRATFEYRRTEDVLERFRIDNDIVFGTGTITATDINTMFDDWCAAEGAKVSRKDFAEWLREQGADPIRQKDEHGRQFRAWRRVSQAVPKPENGSGDIGDTTSQTFSRARTHSKSSGGDVTRVTWPDGDGLTAHQAELLDQYEADERAAMREVA